MIHKIVRYRVRPEALEQVRAAIETFVAAIRENEPHTRYDAYGTEDETLFFHTMAFPDSTAERAHQTAPYTLEFVDVLYPNCEERPVFNDLNLLWSTEGAS